MKSRVNVLEIELNNNTAKEAMQKVMEYMRTEPMNIVEFISADTLVKSKEDEMLKDNIAQADLVLAGEQAILEVAEITEGKKLQEVGSHLFVKMLLRYFHKNHNRVFILTESEEEQQYLMEYLQGNYRGIQIVGQEIVPTDSSADDMILNSVNGAEADCVLSMISSPFQEAFAVRNRILLNTRIWLGLGKNTPLPLGKKKGKKLIREFMIKRFLKREVEKEKQKRGNV
ncbi:WecB/TagA/CpsF family glycosyltransferase [Faecalimonas sp.]